MNALKTEANRALSLREVLFHKHWGSNLLCLLRCSVVHSILDYGCVVYGSAHSPSWPWARLRLSNGAYRTSPVQSLYEPPLRDRRLTLSCVLRMSWSPRIGHDITMKCDSSSHYLNKPHFFYVSRSAALKRLTVSQRNHQDCFHG